MHTEEEEANSGAGGFASAPNVGGEGTSASRPGTGKSLAFRLCSFFVLSESWSRLRLIPFSVSRSSFGGSGGHRTVIKDVAKDAAAEADKIAAEEAARGVAEDATKGPAGEPSKAAAEEAGKGPAGEAGKAAAEEGAVDDQPSSSAASGSGRYLRVSDDLFVHLPGASSSTAPVEGEVFDEEVLAAAGLEVVDEPSTGGDGS